MALKFVIPAKTADGKPLRIRNPATKAVIPEEGCELEEDRTVRMHIRDGALIDRDAAKPAVAPERSPRPRSSAVATE